MHDRPTADWQPTRIGIISARHEMPVDEYLVESVNPGQSAYDQIYEAIVAWLARHPGVGHEADKPLHIYYSGLTEATLAVTDALHNLGCHNAYLMRFDRVLEDYEPLHRHIQPCRLDGQESENQESRPEIGTLDP